MKDTCTKLIQKAKMATQEWSFERQSWDNDYFSWELNTDSSFIAIHEHEYETSGQAKFDADFISACSHQTISALCERILKLEDVASSARRVLMITSIKGNPERELQDALASLEKDERK